MILKLKALNQTITVIQSTAVIDYPYFDVNYASATIFVSRNVNMFGDKADKETLNQVIGKGTVKILKNRFSGIDTEDIVYDWLLSKTNFIKDVIEVKEEL